MSHVYSGSTALVSDLLAYDLPLQRSYYPMGIPLRIVTNSDEIIATADAMWARYPAIVCKEPPVTFRIMVENRNSVGHLRPAMPQGHEHLVSIVHGADNFAICDLATSFAFARLTRDVAENTAYLRSHFLELAVYTMMGARHLFTLHAACIALNNRAILLCGESGAGKTSLAYACAKRGWTYLADGATSVIRNRTKPTVAGRPFSIRFRAAARYLFPELRACWPAQQPNGKLDIEVNTEELGIPIALESEASHVVFLNRGKPGTRTRIIPFSRDAAFLRCSPMICFGDGGVRASQTQALLQLLELPVLELTWSDLADAEAVLRNLASE